MSSVTQSSTTAYAGSGGTTYQPSFGNTPAAGSTVVLIVSMIGQACSGVGDNQTGNTYTKRASATMGANGGHEVSLWSAPNVNSSGTFTLTITAAGQWASCTVTIVESGGLLTPTNFDRAGSNTNDNNLNSTGTVQTTADTTQADEIVFAGAGQDSSDNTSITPDGAWTQLGEVENRQSATYSPLNSIYKNESTTGTKSHSWTFGTNVAWGTVIATFKNGATTVDVLPATDDVVGAWTNQDGSGASNALAAATSDSDDATYAQSEAAPSASSCRMSLGVATNPNVDTSHSLTVRGQLSAGAVGGTMSLETELMNNGAAFSPRIYWTDTLTTLNNFVHNLTTGQADQIASGSAYGNLDVVLKATQAATPAPTLVGVSASGTRWTATNNANLTPALPVGWAAGDYHLLVAQRDDNTAMTTLAPAWTQIAALSSNNGTGHRVELWYRVAQAGDGAPTVTFGSSTVCRGAVIVGVRGVHGTTPIINSSINLNGSVSTDTCATTDISPAVGNTLGVFIATARGQRTAATQPANWSTFAIQNTTVGNDASVGVATRTYANSGSYGTPSTTWTSTTTGATEGILLAFQPPVPTGRAQVTRVVFTLPASTAPGPYSLQANQPAGSGTVSRVLHALRSLTAAQPSGSATVSRHWVGARSLAAAQPAASAAVTKIFRLFKSLAANQPAGSALVSFTRNLHATLAANQPYATASVVRKQTLGRVLAASQPNATGTVAKIIHYHKQLTASQPAASAAISNRKVALKSVNANQPTAQGAVTRTLHALRSLAAAQPAGSGVVTRRWTGHKTLGANQPAGSAVLALRYHLKRSPAAAQPAGSATVVRRLHARRSISSTQLPGSATVTRRYNAHRSASASQPTATAHVTWQITGGPSAGGNLEMKKRGVPFISHWPGFRIGRTW